MRGRQEWVELEAGDREDFEQSKKEATETFPMMDIVQNSGHVLCAKEAS